MRFEITSIRGEHGGLPLHHTVFREIRIRVRLRPELFASPNNPKNRDALFSSKKTTSQTVFLSLEKTV